MSIDARVVIGVTGHRKLENPDALRPHIRQALQEMRRTLPPLAHTRYAFTVLSPLADGADRVTASELLKEPDVHLEAILPMPRARYVQTFLSPSSVREFDDLLARARIVRQPYAGLEPVDAYVWVGRHVVDQCDVLIAVWDGDAASGRGGTGEIVEHARRRGCPICWIHTAHAGKLEIDWGAGLGVERFQALDEYNRLADVLPLRDSSTGLWDELQELASQGQLALPGLEAAKGVAPHLERADHLAGRFQHLHYRAGTLVYALAAGAVVVVATQTLLLHLPLIGGSLELGCLTALLAMIYLGKRGRWHGHWMECRYLAERLRSMLYMTACGLESSPEARSRLSRASDRQPWMGAAVASVAAAHPPPPRPHEAAFPAMREFLASAWLDDQAAYHRRKALRSLHEHHVLERAGIALFFVSLVCSAVGLVSMLPGLHGPLQRLLGETGFSWFSRTVSWISLALPASGGAIAAINAHREFRKLAHRSEEMVANLRDLAFRLRDTQSWAEASPVLTETEEILAGENAEWLTSVRFHSLDSPA